MGVPVSGDETSVAPIVLAVVVLCVAVVADYWSAWAWWPPYFRNGVLVYRTRIPIRHPPLHAGTRFLPTAIDLEGEFDDLVGRMLTFQQLGENQVAVRRAFLRWFLFTVPITLHGLIRLDGSSDEIVVDGRANWVPLALVILASAAGLAFPELGLWLPLAVMGGLLAVSIPQSLALRGIGEYMAGRPT